MHKLRTISAPGADRITSKMLRNLDEHSILAVTDLFNECWQAGAHPEQWTPARITSIPKPGKPLDIKNLRPISLTSCLGKLFEHVVLRRLQNHMDEHDLFPNMMIGFRNHLSTQDVMLQISEDALHPRNGKRTRAILALDLTKAFVEALSALDVGSRTFNYVSAFLKHRTAELSFGSLSTLTFTLGSRGTPQGSVLSPLLFNITLIPMATRFIQHSKPLALPLCRRHYTVENHK